MKIFVLMLLAFAFVTAFTLAEKTWAMPQQIKSRSVTYGRVCPQAKTDLAGFAYPNRGEKHATGLALRERIPLLLVCLRHPRLEAFDLCTLMEELAG